MGSAATELQGLVLDKRILSVLLLQLGLNPPFLTLNADTEGSAKFICWCYNRDQKWFGTGVSCWVYDGVSIINVYDDVF